MDKILFLKPFLALLTDGKFFKTIFSWMLKINACLLVLAVLWASWKLWAIVPSNSSLQFFIGALLVEIFLLIAGIIVFNILWIRADDVQNLLNVQYYPVTPIIVITIKTSGEIIALLYILSGFVISLTTWIAGPHMIRLIQFLVPLPGIVNGLSAATTGVLPLIFGSFLGFLILVSCYYIAELAGAFVEIARNTKKGR